jgi:multisubunit Na+/H+ antiporter MnhB subunit
MTPEPPRPAPPRPAGVHPEPEAVPAGLQAGRARPDGSIVSTVTYLLVLACTAFGVYIAWRRGSAGGGDGGVVGGVALLVAAVVRLVLPDRFAGLLGTRKRVTDVLTFTIFGTGLLVAGLVLPR